MMQSRPVVFSYCATYLPPEMLHVYRQVNGIQRFENHVLTRHRANADQFPFPRVHELRKPPWRFLRRLFYRAQRRSVPVSRFEIGQMLRLVAQHDGKLAHVYLGTEASRVLGFIHEVRAARIVSFHGADLSASQDATRYQPLWPEADLVLCRSKSLRDELAARGCPPEKIRLNYTGVPVSQQKLERRFPDANSGPVQLLQVCRLIEKKGLDVTLRAVAKLRSSGIPARITLAGEGPLRDELTQLAEQLGIAEFVTFAGFVKGPALEQLFLASDIFVHPSRSTASGDREGIPNSLIEAMGAGLPVISTRHSGIPEAVQDGVSGLLIDCAEVDPLVAAIRRLLASPDLYAAISLHGWKTVHERFSVERCVANLEMLYEEAIALRCAVPG